MAEKYNLQIDQGATYFVELEYNDSNNNPIDLAEYSGSMQIRSNYADFNDSTLYLTISSSVSASKTSSGLNFNGIDGLTPTTSGSVGLFISATDTETLNFEEGLYDIELNKNGVITRFKEGKVLVSREITRLS